MAQGVGPEFKPQYQKKKKSHIVMSSYAVNEIDKHQAADLK
jgi:hypothetical protein